MTLRLPLSLAALVTAPLLLGACDLETVQQIEDTAAAVRETADQVSTRSDQIQQVAQDPLGAARQAVLGAAFSKMESDQPGIFVLTDLATGCQWLATYGRPDDVATSMEPRTEPGVDGAVQQVCVTLPGSANG